MGRDVSDLTGIGQSRAAFDQRVWPRLRVGFEVIGPLFAALDVVTVIVSGLLGGLGYHAAIGEGLGEVTVHLGLGMIAGFCHCAVANHIGLYAHDRLLEGQQDKRRVLASWALAILILTVALFLLKSSADISRGTMICVFLLGGVALPLVRRVAQWRLRSAIRRGDIKGRIVLVMGTRSELAQLSRAELLLRFGLDELGRIVLPDTAGARGEASTRDDLIAALRRQPVEEIIVALPWSQLGEFDWLLACLRAVPLPVRLLPDEAVSSVVRRQTAQPQYAYIVEMQRAPLSGLERCAKRILDIVVAVTSLMALSPLLLLATLAVKLESAGPVIFRQRRRGFNGETFMIYKFRSMTVMEDGAAVLQAQRHDPRVTQTGRFLRATSIDEIPQLWNVLRGEMSIVGPRPHALAHDDEYGKMIANYALRHHVKPGMTGWAQVNGLRGGTPRLEMMQQRVALDLWYIDHWSLSLDVYIMIRTAFELMRHRNAY
uniref:undecaprenyl-phosphate glucose phosphotransferase n=1 Tax=Bradyrhizobium sp. (strain ORS 278) TaxID=114615 RepID=UPI000682D771|nr:undecaprenyl-phosphate glucose phosphotransferase [Bradyrhizobium sp. ORS 278]